MILQDIDGTLFKYNPKEQNTIYQLKQEYSENLLKLKDLAKYEDEIMKYIILFYDINTPLRILYPDFNKRKIEAALMAGFKLTKEGKFQDNIKNMLIGLDDSVNTIIVSYMMNFFNPDYIVLMDYWDMLLKLSREIKKSSEPTKEMIDNMSKLNEHIKQKTELIFSGKESLKLEQELYEQLLQNRMSLKPEDIVSRKKNNEKVVNIDLYE